nr:hypothetical protein BaRGS_024231 [Batillaria attramentaria]
MPKSGFSMRDLLGLSDDDGNSGIEARDVRQSFSGASEHRQDSSSADRNTTPSGIKPDHESSSTEEPGDTSYYTHQGSSHSGADRADMSATLSASEHPQDSSQDRNTLRSKKGNTSSSEEERIAYNQSHSSSNSGIEADLSASVSGSEHRQADSSDNGSTPSSKHDDENSAKEQRTFHPNYSNSSGADADVSTSFSGSDHRHDSSADSNTPSAKHDQDPFSSGPRPPTDSISTAQEAKQCLISPMESATDHHGANTPADFCPPAVKHGKGQRRQRTQYSPADLQTLEEAFQENNYPGIAAREALARTLHVSEARIQAQAQPQEEA